MARKYLNFNVLLTIVFCWCCIVGAVQPWTLNVIAPVTNLVSIKEDLDFRMLLTGGIKP